MKIKNIFLTFAIQCFAFSVLFAQEADELTIEKIYRDMALDRIQSNSIQWLPDSRRFSYSEKDEQDSEYSLILNSVEEGSRKVLLSPDELDDKSLDFTGYQWLPDESGIVFQGTGDIWFYSVSTDSLHALTDTPDEEEVVRIAPNGQMIAFVRDNDLYIYNLQTADIIKLTNSGSKTILNGKLDWVYQEELMGRGNFNGFWWSPDSKYIAFLQFDESSVPEYPLIDWIPTHPGLEMMRYPKAGDSNPTVRLGVIPVEKNAKTTWMNVQADSDGYIPRVYWIPGSKQIAFMYLDRLQQHLKFFRGTIRNGTTRLILEETDPHWINIEDHTYFLEDGNRFIWGSEQSGYRHLYLYNLQGELIARLTEGEWIVDNLVDVDENRGRVYFTSTKKDIRERHLYQVDFKGNTLRKLSDGIGTHEVSMSSDFTHYIDEYTDVVTPRRVSLNKSNGSLVRYLENDNREFARKYSLTAPEFLTFEDEEGRTFYGKILKPLDFEPDVKYPVLVYVYGGPHSQVVKRSFGRSRDLWHQMLTRKGYVIFSMDNRGSYGRGHSWETPIYKDMGRIELADQLKGIEYLKSLPYVDPERIGIWGWSYGGYMTLYALTHSKQFKMGISVAPVTDWHNYDTIYTERYMSLPSLNPTGYEQSSPANYADQFFGALLLVHGTGDDNVHMQNTMQMTDALIDAGIDFELMLYPRQKHGISPYKDRVHLFHKMTTFLENNLKDQ